MVAVKVNHQLQPGSIASLDSDRCFAVRNRLTRQAIEQTLQMQKKNRYLVEFPEYSVTGLTFPLKVIALSESNRLFGAGRLEKGVASRTVAECVSLIWGRGDSRGRLVRPGASGCGKTSLLSSLGLLTTV